MLFLWLFSDVKTGTHYLFRKLPFPIVSSSSSFSSSFSSYLCLGGGCLKLWTFWTKALPATTRPVEQTADINFWLNIFSLLLLLLFFLLSLTWVRLPRTLDLWNKSSICYHSTNGAGSKSWFFCLIIFSLLLFHLLLLILFSLTGVRLPWTLDLL